MDENVYQTPQAELVEENIDAPEFYAVSLNKFLILFFATFSLYQIYWFYKNWSFYSKSSGESMWPIMRGLFSIFFAHSLFSLVDEKLKQVNSNYTWPASMLATIYVIFTIVGNVSDRLSAKDIGSPITDFIGLLVLPIVGWSLYKAQKAVNLSLGDPEGKTNNFLSPLNYVWIILGVVLWAIAGFGLYAITWAPELLSE